MEITKHTVEIAGAGGNVQIIVTGQENCYVEFSQDNPLTANRVRVYGSMRCGWAGDTFKGLLYISRAEGDWRARQKPVSDAGRRKLHTLIAQTVDKWHRDNPQLFNRAGIKEIKQEISTAQSKIDRLRDEFQQEETKLVGLKSKLANRQITSAVVHAGICPRCGAHLCAAGTCRVCQYPVPE